MWLRWQSAVGFKRLAVAFGLAVTSTVAVASGCGDHPVAGGKVDGKAVYDQACASCHGPTGKPSAAMVAQLGVRDLTEDAFRSRATLPLIRHQVMKGSPDKRMPALEYVLSSAQIDAVAQYVLAMIGRGSAPASAPGQGSS